MDPTCWQQRFSDKITTPEGAARSIPRGRRILIGSGAAEPARLVEAMVEHGHHLEGNDIVHLLTLGPAPYVKAGLERRFRHTAFFIGPNVRDAVAEGRADFMPVFLSDIPELIRSRRVRIDVALIQVSPPDAHGYVSLGVSVDIVRAAIDAADLILAEVNPRMPRTHGDSFLNIDRIQHLVPVDAPLPTRAAEPLDEVDRAIGRHIASLIPNGATLQTGIGRIPDAALAALEEHHDLGVHTEMFSDGVMCLALRGVINGRKKTLLPGKLVTSFVMGSQALYDWVHDNPVVEMRPSGFTNDPFIIAENDMMIAINAALAVDLTGQVAADTLMGRFFSGIGGQVDFIRGSARSRGGKPIIALRSTAKEGQVSRIVPGLEQGAGVVTSRGDVHYVVTEHGVADLWGKNIRQRALALIDIAHPDHRADLLAAAKQRRYVFGDQACARSAYPWEEARRETLPGGHEVLVRPLRISDEDGLKDLFYRLSDESTYQRFMKFKRSHPHEELLQLVCLDYEQNMGLVVIHSDSGCEEVIGLARYDVAPATRRADIAFVVRDEWQGRGVGTLLMRRMAEVARARGVTGFFADVLASNKPMMAIFHKSGLPVKASLREGVYHVEIDFS
ncbi:bifunctional acetyl-CoA hydrolase/transferase family protein/GNAT family N-acetyltransferase [Polyangium sp. 6x1]|uniref:bifunctional acetyl-CoA hydrolase/transferase family protein/GNAT family N-acetyltransferase n=1 Tax=Polyangium sp. 6x1 TaxID=3042689 RepID=UPI002482FAD6|nr:bifunctional acetyl-CoA hydrolase/transferase family protein/GNAT family N-acetyltransferase [Polyangium sp. 6x1]MDI1446774.1 GNAT family N-acetyltransferase [Polyangium sp. 6x1]